MIKNDLDERARANEPPSRAKQTGRISTKKKKLAWACAIGVLLLALAVVLWQRRFHSYTPLDAVYDLRAAVQVARENPADPVLRFLELRYGAMTDPANRVRAFQDMFNIGHIEGLYLLWHNGKDTERIQTTIAETTSQTFAKWRSVMSPEERQTLAAYFHSPAGRAQVQQATAFYMGKDVRFRSDSAPVIKALLTTIGDTQNP
jgi:hypothetical protein